ncbi:FKBP-type peptidyl-prolyl cis-trans isomerase [Parapedobacter koreensis]|nr:FKBP-type peptidyl-prolyl cis-trans isomerase [Parapedobacter koreensis]
MKKINVLLVGLVAVGMSSCLREDDFDPAAQQEIEKPIIEAYANEHLNVPRFHEPTGIWYEIIQPGDPASYQYKVVPRQDNPSQLVIEAPTVHVNYTGRLVQTNTVFDSNDDEDGAEISLANVILAWQAIFFPKEIIFGEDGELLDEPVDFGGITQDGLKAGAVFRIVTPSRWAYQNRGQGTVPANAPLYFEITVLDISEPSSNNP